MPIQIQGGPAMGVVVDSSGARAEGGAAIPVAVVSDGRVQSAGKATRVVVVTNPDHIEGGPAIPVVAAAAGDPVEGGPAMRVYVVQGSLGGGAAPSSLLTSLVAYWKLEEASGTRVDATGRGNDLAPTNAPGNATGRIGNAVDIVGGSAQALSAADTADLSMGDIDFTVAFWFKTPNSNTQGLVTKWNTVGNQREWLVVTQSGPGVNFYVSGNGTAVVGPATAAYSTGAYQFVVAWHDSVANTINVSVNDGTTVSVSTSLGVFDGTATFLIGKDNNGSQYSGQVDEVGIWKRKLTAAERTTLYNAGAGRTYPFVGT